MIAWEKERKLNLISCGFATKCVLNTLCSSQKGFSNGAIVLRMVAIWFKLHLNIKGDGAGNSDFGR